MGADIDSLEIGIQASAVQAEKALDSLVTKLRGISTQLGITSNSLGRLSGAVNNLTRAMTGFKDSNIKASDFTRIFNGVEKISTLDSSAVNQVAGSVNNLLKNVSGIGNIKFDSQKFNEMANSISKLGRTSVTEATQNLEFLKTSLSDFITGLNGVGTLNFNPGALAQLVSSISRIGGKNATQAVQNLPLISKALRDFIAGMNSVGSVTFGFDGLNNLVNSIARLGGTKATQAVANLKPIKEQILRFVSGLNGIGALKFDVTGLANLVSSITKLGGKAATTAIPNIQQLGVALSQLMKTLSRVPVVSQNLIQMTNALAKLASSGSRVSSAGKAMQNSLNGYSAGARRASNSTKGLASQIGMFYAKCFLLIRGVKALWKATNSSMDYIETLNYFDAAWEQVADNAVKNWKEAGYDSAEEYADSFAKRAQELTGKLSGFTADENGNLVSTGMPSLGLDPEQVMNYQATFGQMASSMGVASETAAKLSRALTQIGADLASVKNLKFEDVWNDMASGMVGMSRTLDKYGVNIRNVNLQEKLYELGIDTKIAKLGQQDKALLRTIILLESTKYAWGDMADTIGQPANQLRLLQANFANLARTIGNLFLPIVSKVLPYINALVIALQRLFAWLGGLLGIKVGGFSSSIGSGAAGFEDMEESADGIADSTGDAAKNTKKMRDYLMGIDELNVLSNDEDKSGESGTAGGGVGGGLLDDAFNDALAEYQAAWDAAFANMENRSQEIADRIVNAFKSGDYFGIGQYIGNSITDSLESINWESVYRIAQNFGTGFAEFLNGLISPELFSAFGATLAGALNTAIYTALSFGQTFDWTNLGNSIAAGVNRFFTTFDFSAAGLTITTFATGVLDAMILAVGNIDWNVIGTQIGNFLNKIDFSKIGEKVGKLIWKAINAGIEVWKGAFKAAPIETAIISAVGLLQFTGLGKVLAVKITTSIFNGLLTGLSFSGIGSLLAKAFPSSAIIATITTTMAETGATLPAVLSGLILTPIKTFFTVTIPGMITGALSGIGSSIVSGIAALASTLGVSVVAAGALILAAVAAVVTGIVYTVTHWEEIKEFWTVKVPAWWNGTAIPFFQSIPGKMSEIWESVKKAASDKWNLFLEFMGGIPDKVGDIISNTGEWFNQLPGKIGVALGYALGTVTAWGVELYNYLSTKIPEIILNVVAWFSELPGKIYTAISTFLSHVATWGSEILEAFRTNVNNAIANVITWFSELPSKIYEAIITIKEKIETWGKNAITFFKIEVPKIVDKVIEFFGELPEKIVDVGKNLIEGLWNGITGTAEWLKKKVKEFCGGILEGFKIGFDTHSPSKETEEIGKYLPEGLIKGITSVSVMPCIESFTSGIITALSVAFNMSKFIQYGASVVDGINRGFMQNKDTTLALIATWANSIQNNFTDALALQSGTSKFWSFAQSVVTGFNNGITANYKSTKSPTDTWTTAIVKWFKDAFGLNAGGSVPKTWAKDIVNAYNTSINTEHSTSQPFMEKWAESIRNWFIGKDSFLGVNEIAWTDFAKKIVVAFNEGIETEHISGMSNIQKWAKHVKMWFWGTENLNGTDGLYEDFYNIAKRINEGFAKGIDDFAHLAKSAIKKWASEAMEAAEEEFDINSPSKRFYRMGTYDIEGFVNAVKEMAPVSLTQIGDWASGISSTFANGLEFAVPHAYEYAYAGYGSSQSDAFMRNDSFNGGGIRELIDFSVQKELLIEQNEVLKEQNEILTQLLEKDSAVVIGGREIVNAYDSTKRRSGYPVRK